MRPPLPTPRDAGPADGAPAPTVSDPGWVFEWSVRKSNDLFSEEPFEAVMLLATARLAGYEDADGWKMPSIKIGASLAVSKELIQATADADQVARNLAQSALYRQARKLTRPAPAPPPDRHPRITRALARWDRLMDRRSQR